MNKIVGRMIWVGAVAIAATAAAQPFRPKAGLRDIMAHIVDPAADYVWSSVSATVTEQGTHERQPRSDAEWGEVRRQAMILAESSNLMMIEGRRVSHDGKPLADHGTPGNLTAEEVERTIAADRAGFLVFARDLHSAGEAMVAAAEARSTQGLLDAGDSLYQACEGCHQKFWYPGEQIPAFPDQAPGDGS